MSNELNVSNARIHFQLNSTITDILQIDLKTIHDLSMRHELP
jgi:hypothetical protein